MSHPVRSVVDVFGVGWLIMSDGSRVKLPAGNGSGLPEHTHDGYLEPGEVLAGVNVTVDTATVPGSVVINAAGGGDLNDVVFSPTEPPDPNHGTIWVRTTT